MTAKPAKSAFILASGSSTRRQMLQAAGLEFEIELARVDEARLREIYGVENPGWTPPEIAEVLAKAKAQEVSGRHTDRLVVGADQVLSLEGTLIHKAADLSEARENLMKMRGRVHELHSAVSLARAGAAEWTISRTARLTMRDFSMDFLDDYIERTGEKCLASVGVYQIESLGLQLFDRVDGDHFTILGLPLLELLAELRKRRVLMT